MIRLIGALLILGGTGFYGARSVHRLHLRVRCLSGLVSCLQILSEEIGEALTPLPSVISQLSQKEFAPANSLFAEMNQQMERLGELSFSEIWKESVHSNKSLNLNRAEKLILAELGNSLGRYSASEQQKMILFAVRRLSKCAEKAEEESVRDSRVQAVLSIAAGIFTVVIFA